MDKIIRREQNLAVNVYRIHAEDTDHPFNWFYQRLLEKERQEHKLTETRVEISVFEKMQETDRSVLEQVELKNDVT